MSGAILEDDQPRVTPGLAAYQALRDEKPATLPGVQRLTSTIVMKPSSTTGPTPRCRPPTAPRRS